MPNSENHLDALTFAEAWIAAWNRRDVEAVLQHFHDDVEFTSPVAREIGFNEEGKIRGKEQLRQYWTAALRRNTNLHFELLRVYHGTETMVIEYRTQTGAQRAEVLSFKGKLIGIGHGLFAVG